MTAQTEQTLHSESKTKIFISYSRKDLTFADRLDAALKARGGEKAKYFRLSCEGK